MDSFIIQNDQTRSMPIGYYVPVVPENPNTTRHRHARAIGERPDAQLLLTEREPPEDVSLLYPYVEVLPCCGSSTIPQRIYQGRKLVNEHIGKDGKLVTGIGIGPCIVGYITSSTWIADVYDDPIQFITDNSGSKLKYVEAKLQHQLLRSADRAIIIQHPSSPLQAGQSQIHARNGAPTDHVDLSEKPPREPLRCVIAGKTRLEEGMQMTLQGIEQADIPVKFDVFGEPYHKAEILAEELDINNSVTFHGAVDYDTVIDTVAKSHVGFCLLPERQDWDYSYPIKIGEYMAAGVLPITTPRPGMLDLIGEVGKFCESPHEVSMKLEQLFQASIREYMDVVENIRKRAEDISWDDELSRFNLIINDNI